MKVSIIGATGMIGSSAAFNIAVRGPADEIVLISRRQDLAAHHALDIQTSIAGRENTLVRAGVIDNLENSDVVIIAAGATSRSLPSRRDYLLANVPIVRQAGDAIIRYCPDAVVITVTNPVDIINYALHSFSKLRRRQLIGYSLNDTLRFRRLIAGALKTDTKRVRAVVIGAHGTAQVPLFSSITVDGDPFITDESLKSAVRAGIFHAPGKKKTPRTGLSSAWTSGMGLADIVSAVRDNNATLIPCSVVLNGEFGYQGLSMGVPAIIGREGVRQVAVCRLSTEEEAELRESAATIREGIDYVAETFGNNR